MPDAIYNWLLEYLEDRRHYTSFEGRNSTVATINASVVQGSVIGPPKVHRHHMADLHPSSPKNRLMKYADDSSLLIGSRNIQSVHDELSNITAWAARRNLHPNPAKTREMVVIRKTWPS